jgi:hypothetical protein
MQETIIDWHWRSMDTTVTIMGLNVKKNHNVNRIISEIWNFSPTTFVIMFECSSGCGANWHQQLFFYWALVNSTHFGKKLHNRHWNDDISLKFILYLFKLKSITQCIVVVAIIFFLISSVLKNKRKKVFPFMYTFRITTTLNL